LPGGGASTGAGFGSNEVNDNDSFRVRRAQLRFTMDIHENVTAYVMFDPAREATSFRDPFNNQSDTVSGDGSAAFNSGLTKIPFSFGGDPQAVGNLRNAAVRDGSGNANRLLQDAYINYHGILPHHDVTVGQFKRRLGEEGTRDSSKLDFIERSMITQLANMRDLGAQVHGTWWDDRLQYWLGTFGGSGTAFQQRQNRSDDNDEKDIVATVKKEGWNSYTIIAKGNHLIQKVNGNVTVDVTDHQEKRRAMKGLLALQLHAGPPMLVQFKNIRIKMLDK